MSIYCRLYMEGTQLSPDLVLTGSFTGISSAQTENHCGVGVDRTVETHQDWFDIDSSLVYPPTNLTKDVLDENWDDMVGWTNYDTGTSISEINPTSRLHQKTISSAKQAMLYRALSSTGTNYTMEVRSLVDVLQNLTSYSFGVGLTGFGDLLLVFGYDSVTGYSYCQVYSGAGSQKYYVGITAMATYRLLISNVPFPSAKGGGGWFLI